MSDSLFLDKSTEEPLVKASSFNQRFPKLPVLIIFGATASGKTSLGEHLFSKDASSVLKGKAEIISADSMQVYTRLNIGTAKPSADLQARLPHHLIDVCSPKEQFGVGEFVPLADTCVQTIFARHQLPVMLGGTAFYIKNFMYGLPITPRADEQTRQKLQDELELLGADVLHKRLQQLDPQSGARIHPHDTYRILRALEVHLASGKPLSYFSLQEQLRPEYDFFVVGIDRSRQQLYERINKRVEQMFDEGLPDEFFSLITEGFSQADPGMQAIGYREFFDCAEQDSCNLSEVDLEKVKELIKKNSRKYAKRQQTFFQALPNVWWVTEDDFSLIEKKCVDFCLKYALV